MSQEVEIKFWIADPRSLRRALRQDAFRLQTRRRHEFNTLYDLPRQALRRKGELLRLRKYGSQWILTHKGKGKVGRHKSRTETEVRLIEGAQMEHLLRNLGYRPSFRYEKYREEWSDGMGHVVIDETPIGILGEIEGAPRWIDRTAKTLGIEHRQYLTASYAELFYDWKKRTRSPATAMTFRAVGKR
ncbi:MAG: class IV adenylate cyclase [Acidobacteria bacterium]|nr:class IV adenylate cyclase [Acidobacteriota bacterium]